MVDQAREVIFKKETVSKLLMLFFKDDKSKVSNDSVSLMAEMLRIFVIVMCKIRFVSSSMSSCPEKALLRMLMDKYRDESTRRAIKHAENEDCVGVDLEHVERILPQLKLAMRKRKCEQSLLEVDDLVAGKIGKIMELTDFDKDQIVMAKRLGQRISKRSIVVCSCHMYCVSCCYRTLIKDFCPVTLESWYN